MEEKRSIVGERVKVGFPLGGQVLPLGGAAATDSRGSGGRGRGPGGARSAGGGGEGAGESFLFFFPMVQQKRQSSSQTKTVAETGTVATNHQSETNRKVNHDKWLVVVVV